MKRIRGFLNAEPEKYRPEDEWSSEELALARSAVHNSAPDLYAWCPRGCGKRFEGSRQLLAVEMQAHLDKSHG
jgi:hypothetical protein